VLENILSQGVSNAVTDIKIGSADLLNTQNELEKAYIIYKDILGENPRQSDALFGIALILEKQQKFDLAIQFLSKAIESKPDQIKALLTRGRILRRQGIFEQAMSDFTKVIEKQKNNYEALIARGITYGQTSNFIAAIDDFNSATKVNPNRAEAFYNRGVVSEKLYKFDSAIEDYSMAIALNPTDYKAYNNRGVALRETKCFGTAIKDFDKSIEINPDFAEGYYNKSLTLLSVGKLKEGFKLYEYRWKTLHFQSQLRHFSQPLWLGNADLTGKTILLHSEQGLGDSIQFCRYIKFFEDMKCRVLLEIEKPLMTIMQCLLPPEHIFEKGSAQLAFDFHCPLMSLPLAFGTTKLTPPETPYLRANCERVNFWRSKLKKENKPIVGIVWKGNNHHINDSQRSMSLEEIVEFLSDDIAWVCLQKELTNVELSIIKNKENFIYFGDILEDFRETAALCSAISCLVSVDTSTAHLAGAIGKRTYLLLRNSADWRWGQDKSRTRWYNYMMIYRRSPVKSWGNLIQSISAEILMHKDRPKKI
jgi:tetratricopeptide (TPR) repeat protein